MDKALPHAPSHITINIVEALEVGGDAVGTNMVSVALQYVGQVKKCKISREMQTMLTLTFLRLQLRHALLTYFDPAIFDRQDFLTMIQEQTDPAESWSRMKNLIDFKVPQVFNP